MPDSTVYISAHVRGREHQVHLMRGDVRTFTADFTAAVPAGDTLASVQWRMTTGNPVAMSAPALSGTKATIRVNAQQSGEVMAKVIGTLGSGSKVSQSIRFIVRGGPYFNGEATPPAGATTLVSP